ncbi:unnamed protein product [Prorocentrum cordatum]|uniref:Uncharacterized protein n=1 Tax=Prorocentrum cordatum TaxID=2364126 RepID=A0ABN9XT04_9DINO|nr:unnamed protein product [Polarella glacialis]
MGLARAPTQRARTKGCDLQKKWNAWGTTGNTLSRPTVCHCGVTGTPISGATRPRWLETQEGKQEEEDDEDKEEEEEEGEGEMDPPIDARASTHAQSLCARHVEKRKSP